MSDARRVLAALRRGEQPSERDLQWVARALADGSLSDAQGGAFAMGICRCPLSGEGRTALTLAMRDSGRVMGWDLPGPVVDKHSTGGLGDCTSLILAPLLAACGAYVPMISGRGLGHTGGTLDKLEAIPGYDISPDETKLHRILAKTGCAIVGAGGAIAPADRRLYAIRDVTATVESLDLITASILSKKLAAGLEALVLDVKFGSGAFMKTRDEAQALAQSLVSTANAAGCKTSALITDMSQPLCPSLGNALEVAEVMSVLNGSTGGPLRDLSLALAQEVLSQAGVGDAATRLRDALDGGAVLERFGAMVHALGGPADFDENWRHYLPEATVIIEVPALQDGIVSVIDGEALGMVVVALGGGRRVESDRLDPAVGLSGVVRLGERVAKAAPLARIHASRLEDAQKAARDIQAAISVGDGCPLPPLIHEKVM